MKLLVIEDNPIQSKLIQLKLKHSEFEHFEIDVAITLNEALIMLYQKKYDLILSDLKLPDTIEFETIETIHDKFPNIPVIVITSQNEQGTNEKLMSRGAVSYIDKSGEYTDALISAILEQYNKIKAKQ